MKRLSFIIFLMLATSLALLADNVQFTASAPRVVEVGEQFEIVYTITAQPSGFRPPEFKGLSLIGGPTTSSSSNVQFINGKVTQSSSFSYTYYFVANNPGTYSFDPAKATVDGKSQLSNGLTVEVVGKAQGNQAQGQSKAAAQTQADNKEVETEGNDNDLFVKVLTDRTTLYQGEHMVVNLKLYSRLNLSGIEKVDYPAFNGFFRQDIETKPLQQLTRESVNGQVYGTGELQKMVLYPQKNGTITIDPFSLQAVVQIPVKGRSRSMFDDFFGPQVREVRKNVSSKPIQIRVLPLPSGALASFNGAVGSYTFKAELDKNHVKTNDAINLKVSISGNGNLKMIEPFELKFPTDFETYDPKVTVNTTTSVAGVSGSKTFEYLIIPRHSGKFTLPAIEFSYFDPKAKQYKTLSSGEMEIIVDKGADDESTTVVSGVSKEEVKFIGKDIQFIKTKTPEFRQKNKFIFGSIPFVWSYLIALLLFTLSIVLWRKNIRESANVVAVRNKKAHKVAHKRLKDANLYMKENKKEEFFQYILKALWGYMGDKLNIPASELSREKIGDIAVTRNISAENIQTFLNLIDNCEFARYAPSEGISQMDAVYKEAIEIISKIEQSVK